jgi:molybdopterin molybdotransferase
MTGAMLPDGADAVVPYESAEISGEGASERVRSREAAAPGQNVRDAGRDLSAGETALAEGREISAHDLGLLVALGVARVRVGARPRAAVISTGDELLEPGAPLRPGAIRDSNLPMLAALLAESGAEVVIAQHTRDDPEEVADAIRDALARADVVLTIGGVSAGDFDPVKLSLESLAGLSLWRVAMKPGRPQAFGRIGDRLFFGLPGNPASVACVFEVTVRPALRRLQGFAELERPRLDVRAAVGIESRAGRTDYVRARIVRRHGEWWATPAGEQVSGHLAPQSRAHVLLEIPESAPRLERGEPATAVLLRWPESRDE